jgi:hypothetical protein
MPRLVRALLLLAGFTLLFNSQACGGTLTGYVRDQNWYAQYQNNPYGVGRYEFAVNANASNSLAAGAAAATGVYGDFSSANAPAGFCTVASWDVWWRSAYSFNVPVPASGSSPLVDLRLKSTMWGYACFWDDTGYSEFGQTFVATGPVNMMYLRLPAFTGAPSYRLTVHEGGPGGPQVGQERVFGTGDQRPVYGFGQMPTVAGRTYYARVRTSPSTTPGVIAQMDPRPDFSDPMPGGCLWLGPAGSAQPLPDRDLGIVIMSDDDGLITDMFSRPGGTTLSGLSVGQTFVARGVNLVSAALWLGDSMAPTYNVSIRRSGPGGAVVGTSKRGKPARVTADPEMIVTWAPGECPLNPGDAYYLEVTRLDGGTIYSAMANPNNPFPYGEAYRGGVTVPGTDLAGTLMEEESTGSATRLAVNILSGPQVPETERLANSLTVRWTNDVPSEGQVEFAADTPPYTRSVTDANLQTSHAVILAGLKPHTMYHYRVWSRAPGRQPAASRDLVICTRPATANLLLNPGFEEGATTTAASRPLTNWTASGGVDIKEANGTWFWGLPPRSGQWLMQGAVNGNSSDGYIYQRVPTMPGKSYTFSAWVTTWPRENNTWKYDVWDNLGGSRLIYMRLGVDPYGGTNPLASTVQWTPRLYSHRRYSNVAKAAIAKSSNVTLFVSMKGDGGEWHLYGVDDCVFTETAVAQPFWSEPQLQSDATFAARIVGDPGVTNLIEISDDLSSWSQLQVLPQTNASTQFIDTTAPQAVRRYYRALLH